MNTLELNVRELSSNELRTIDGGTEPVSAAAAAVVVSIIGGLYLAGEKIGEAIYHLTH